MDAADEFCAFAEENGLEVTREVTYKTPFGNRRYDAVVRDPKTEAASGVEIKSSENAMLRNDADARRQFAADRWINMQKEGVTAIGENEGHLPIRSTYKIQWQVEERPRLWVP